MIYAAFFVLSVAVCAVAFVRLAPFEADRWHQKPVTVEIGAVKGLNSYHVVQSAPDSGLQTLKKVILATPRTRLVAGGLEDNIMTFETRTALMGYPDYTTVALVNGPDGSWLLSVNARARFGMSDLGVNEKRVRHWFALLDD